MKTITTEKQRNEIQEFIQTELLKRGFTAKIISFKEVAYRNNIKAFQFKTENFQTIPILFKEVNISNFNGIINETKKDSEVYDFSITVNCNYSLFLGGSNGTELFRIYGCIKKGKIHSLETNNRKYL